MFRSSKEGGRFGVSPELVELNVNGGSLEGIYLRAILAPSDPYFLGLGIHYNPLVVSGLLEAHNITVQGLSSNAAMLFSKNVSHARI